MDETIMKLLTDLAIIAILSIIIWFVKNKMKALLTSTVNNLIYWAEEKIQGSKMGAVRKAWVIAKLEEAGIKVTASISKLIDALVTIMNVKKEALEAEAASTASAAVNAVIEAAEPAISEGKEGKNNG